MRAYIHAFQGKPWNEECEAAYSGFKKLGIECILFTTNEELDERRPEDIVVGGMLMMEHALHQMNIEIPNYNYPEELRKYRGRDIWTVKLKNLKEETLPIFIKPVKEKVAKGIVVTSWDDIVEYNNLDPEEEIICSDVVNFVSEWRCFIRYGEVIGIQFYNGNRDIECDRTVVEAAVQDFNNIPAACSLDFGVTEDGQTLLIEMNDGFAIGCYGLMDELYAKFLSARWAELVGAIDPWDTRLRKGYVETAMQKENEKIWDAYLAIDVKEKSGNEKISSNLVECLKDTTQFLGLEDFFEHNSDAEVWLTDDVISLKEERDLYAVIHAIVGKNVLVHLRVDSGMIQDVNEYIEKVVKDETSETELLLKWQYLNDNDDKHLIELMKRLPEGARYVVRVYEDGNGVIVFDCSKQQPICYFKIQDSLRERLKKSVSKKIDEIIKYPKAVSEDDRYFGFSVHLKYNLQWKYPDIEDNPWETGLTYESIEYSNDENTIEIAKQLLSDPQLKEIIDETLSRRYGK